jgi:hypothetical protein
MAAIIHPRWSIVPEVAVRRPIRGWIDLVLHDPSPALVVATEIVSGLFRIEQLIRWSEEKAAALPTSAVWSRCTVGGRAPMVSRLLVIRWTRANREAASAARRILRTAYPADPRDALDSLVSDAAWPGAAIVWARIDREATRLVAG